VRPLRAHQTEAMKPDQYGLRRGPKHYSGQAPEQNPGTRQQSGLATGRHQVGSFHWQHGPAPSLSQGLSGPERRRLPSWGASVSSRITVSQLPITTLTNSSKTRRIKKNPSSPYRGDNSRQAALPIAGKANTPGVGVQQQRSMRNGKNRRLSRHRAAARHGKRSAPRP